MGNEKVISQLNRLELFKSYVKDNIQPVTEIRKTVASKLVDNVLSYYTKYSSSNIDSLAYLIKNGFITTDDFSK